MTEEEFHTEVFVKFKELDMKLSGSLEKQDRHEEEDKETKKDVEDLKKWKWYNLGLLAASHGLVGGIKKLLGGE